MNHTTKEGFKILGIFAFYFILGTLLTYIGIKGPKVVNTLVLVVGVLGTTFLGILLHIWYITEPHVKENGKKNK